VGGTGGVFKVSKSGGAATPLWTGSAVNEVALDDAYVYFATSSGVHRIPKAGGTATQLSGGAGSFDIAVDAGNVYVTGSSSVQVVPKTGGAPTPLAGSVTTRYVALDATYVYWGGSGPSGTGEVRKVAKSGGTAELLYSGFTMDVRQLAVDAGFLYFLTQWGVYKIDPANPPTGPAVSALFTTTQSNGSAAQAHGIAVDGGEVFWGSEYAYKIERGSIDGTNRFTLATSTCWDLAVDATYVYFTNRTNTVRRVAR
jgi:hypothetical protein